MKAQPLEKVPEEGGGGRGGGGGGRGLQVERDKKATVGVQNHLELRLGISLNSFGDMGSPSDAKGGGQRFTTTHSHRLRCGGSTGLVMNQRNSSFGAKRWFSETGSSSVDPWSLAARQEKAVFEQTHQKPNPSSTLLRAPPPPPPLVGWPPVRAFRKNLVSQHPPKADMDAEKDAKTMKPMEEQSQNKLQARPTMFVKVNMEGYAVGRKIDLMAHDSYESLSGALQKMFHNFLSVNYPNNMEHDIKDELEDSDYILLYQDHEEDRMLVGDVPWEMFLGSVKRLYIANGFKTSQIDDRKVNEEKQ